MQVLRVVVYVPDSDFFGADQLHIEVSDLGNSGKCPVWHDASLYTLGLPCQLRANATIALSVCSVNDPPVFETVPDGDKLSVTEDQGFLPFEFRVWDVDAASHNASEQIQVTFALDDSGGNSWVSIPMPAAREVRVCADSDSDACVDSGGRVCDLDGDGVEEPCSNTTLRFRGTLDAVNAVLRNVTFSPDFNAGKCWHVIDVTVSDLGNSGECQTNAPLEVVYRLGVTSSSKNKAPVVAVPPASLLSSGEEGHILALGDHLRVTDEDACILGGCLGLLKATVRVVNGHLVFHSCLESDCNIKDELVGAEWTATLDANLDVLTAAFSNVSFVGAIRSSGVESSIALTVDDGGNTGYGGPKTASAEVHFVSNQVADPPSLEVTRPYLVGTTGVPIALDVVTQATDLKETLRLRVFEALPNATRGALLFACVRPPGGKACGSEGTLAPHDSLTLMQGGEEGVVMVVSKEARRVHLWVESLSTVPDLGDTATASQRVVIVFHSPRNQSATQDAESQSSVCLEKVLPDSDYNCSLCEHTCLRVSFTLKLNGTLLLLGRSLSFPAIRHTDVFPFFLNGTAMQIYVNPPSTQRFYTSATSSVADVSVNGARWESAGGLNEWLALDDTFLQPAPGLDFPADINMTVVRGAEDQGAAIAVGQHPSSLNTYQGLVAFSGAEGNNVSFTLIFFS